METYQFIRLIVIDIVAILSFFVPVFISMVLVIRGIKCLMRAEMLKIYYRYKDKEIIRQFELENFLLLYKAYKALRGNSFIDIIYKEVKTWKVIS